MRKTKPKNKLKKPKGRRGKTKYPALKPDLNLKTRWEEIYDVASYADQLNDKEKEWLNSFCEEFINANFKHNGTKHHKSVESKRALYVKNNARNRDVYTQAKAQNKALYIEDVFNDEEELNDRLKDHFNLHDEGNDGN